MNMSRWSFATSQGCAIVECLGDGLTPSEENSEVSLPGIVDAPDGGDKDFEGSNVAVKNEDSEDKEVIQKVRVTGGRKRVKGVKTENGVYLNDGKKRNDNFKPYLCNQCPKRFLVKWALQRHMKIHDVENPLSCTPCQRTFTCPFRFQKHLNSHPLVERTEQGFKCDTCGKMFKSKHALRSHAVGHTGEKPFKCQTCGMDFVRQSHLLRHAKIHSGQKPYTCEICQKAFLVRQYLTRHMRCHVERDRFKCMFCSKSYLQNLTLKKHLDTAHRELLGTGSATKVPEEQCDNPEEIC